VQVSGTIYQLSGLLRWRFWHEWATWAGVGDVFGCSARLG